MTTRIEEVRAFSCTGGRMSQVNLKVMNIVKGFANEEGSRIQVHLIHQKPLRLEFQQLCTDRLDSDTTYTLRL